MSDTYWKTDGFDIVHNSILSKECHNYHQSMIVLLFKDINIQKITMTRSSLVIRSGQQALMIVLCISCSKGKGDSFRMEGVLFALGIEEDIEQIYNRDKYLKMRISYGNRL